MKRIAICLFFALGVSIPNAQVAIAETLTFPCGGTATYSVLIPDGVAKNGNGCSGNLILDRTVKVIGHNAFSDSKLISVTIPSSVVEIKFQAFYQTRINAIIIPDSVKVIGQYAFSGILTAKTFYLGKSVIDIGEEAFSGSSLGSVVIPDSVTSIGRRAFNFSSLSSVVIGKSVTRLNDWTFGNNDFSSITIPYSVSSIGDYVFFGSDKLEKVTIVNPSIEISDGAFTLNKLRIRSVEYCGDLKSIPIGYMSNSNLAISYLTPICTPELLEKIRTSKQEAEAKAAAELKAKQEAEARAASELKAKQEADAKAAALKKTTITCVKGKLTKRVTALKPKCPTGYKLKK